MRWRKVPVVTEIKNSLLGKPGGRIVIMLYLLLMILVILEIINSIYQGSYLNLFPCVKVTILLMVPWILERKFNIEFSPVFIIITFLFIYAAIILGEIKGYYIKFSFWDTMLHTVNGFLCAELGFVFVDIIFNQRIKDQTSIKIWFSIIAAICFSMTIAIFWEFYEFGMDNVMNSDMQKDTIVHTIKTKKINENTNSVTVMKHIDNVSLNGESLPIGGYLDIGLYDTMYDLFDNLIGALTYGVLLCLSNRTGQMNDKARIFLISFKRKVS